MKPHVSIIIPVYNRVEYIAQCIQSAIDQTFTHIEVIVIDNASDDGTWEVCCNIAVLDPRIRIFRNEENIGPVRNWIKCLNKAQGRYAKILFSDDTINPEFIEEALPMIENSNVGFVFSAVTIEDKSNNIFSDNYLLPKRKYYSAKEYISDITAMAGMFPISPGSALFRLDDLKKYLISDIPTREYSNYSIHGIGPDLLLMLEVAYKYNKIGYIRRPLVKFSAHGNSISINSAPSKISYNYDMILCYFYEKHKIVDDEKLINRISYHLLVHGNSFEYGKKNFNNFLSSASNKSLFEIKYRKNIFKLLMVKRMLIRVLYKYLFAVQRQLGVGI